MTVLNGVVKTFYIKFERNDNDIAFINNDSEIWMKLNFHFLWKRMRVNVGSYNINFVCFNSNMFLDQFFFCVPENKTYKFKFKKGKNFKKISKIGRKFTKIIR